MLWEIVIAPIVSELILVASTQTCNEFSNQGYTALGKCPSVVQGGPQRSWSPKGGRGPCGSHGPL